MTDDLPPDFDDRIREISGLDDLPPDYVIPDADAAMSVPYLIRDLAPAASYLISGIARLEAYPVATATPAERADLLELRELLSTLDSALRIRLQAIDLAFKRGMEELGARELPIEGWNPVHYVPDEGAWVVKADSLRHDLAALMPVGLITAEDLEKAFKTTVTVTADNRVLNGLVKRGVAVENAILANRERREGVPLQGKLTLPHKRRSEEA